MMAASLAEGETLMENCAREPEVSDVAALLNKMGARIEGAGTSTIRIQGVDKLHGARHRIIPDRIEAGTFVMAGVLTGGDLIVSNCEPRHLGALLQKLQECGVKMNVSAISRHSFLIFIFFSLMWLSLWMCGPRAWIFDGPGPKRKKDCRSSLKKMRRNFGSQPRLAGGDGMAVFFSMYTGTKTNTYVFAVSPVWLG